MSIVHRVSILFFAPLSILACADVDAPGGVDARGVNIPAITTIASIGLSPTSNGDDPGDDDGVECAEIVNNAKDQLPADILFVIDNSSSMKNEAESVKANMNQFSAKIINSGVDVHVVLITSISGGEGMCIDPPLGGGGCPGLDNNLPIFLHINRKIDSHNALQKLLDYHKDWKGQMRPNANKHIVVVSDDDSALGADAFEAAFKALDPSYANYRFHAIVGKNDAKDAKWCDAEPVCCGLTAAAGKVYLELIDKTDGVLGDLCKQDFTPVFKTLSSEVIEDSGIACKWEIPEPVGDDAIDLDKVKFEFNDGMGQVLVIDEVPAKGACNDVANGWYFDKPNAPTELRTCPKTCNKIQKSPKASVNITFGCKVVIPK